MCIEIVLLEISNSMKPYASVVHAYTNKLIPEIDFFEPKQLDEASNRVPPTSHYWIRIAPIMITVPLDERALELSARPLSTTFSEAGLACLPHLVR